MAPAARSRRIAQGIAGVGVELFRRGCVTTPRRAGDHRLGPRVGGKRNGQRGGIMGMAWAFGGAAFGGVAVGLLSLCCTAAQAQSLEELRDMPIAALSKLDVTSVTRATAALADSPASIYVITHDDIVRSGTLTLPGILRQIG